MTKTQPKESKRISRMVELKDYDHTSKLDDFLEVTEWSNGEGFDLNISRGEQHISFTWGEFAAMQAALGDWIDKVDNDDDICPYIYTSEEGTSYCKLSVQTTEILSKLMSK